jgi:integrase
MKLTQRRIEGLECPANKKDMLVFDDEQHGLGVRVTAGGGKSYLVQYRRAGQKRRVPLGSCSAISLASAREAVRALMGDVSKGRDPASERKAAALEAKRQALTLGTLIEHWEKLHLAGKRPNYAAAATATLRRVFAKHLDAPAGRLDRAEVVRVLDCQAKDGKAAMAGAAARYGSALFGWTVKRGTLASNPFERVPVAPTVRRDRVLSDDEIRRVWRATEGPRAFNAIVRALLLTGQRREEVSGLTSSELDPGLSVWTLPAARSKNGKPHIIPISAQMGALLRAQPCVSGTDLVFPGERGLFSGWSKSKARLDRRSGVSGWTLHDLRRTAATGMAEFGIAPHVIEAVLNHSSGHKAGVAGIYNQARYASEMRRALNLWGAHIATVVEGCETGDNATPTAREAHRMEDDRDAQPFVGYRLDDEQRRRVADCLGKDGLRLPSDRFQCFVRDVEASISDFLLSARGASFRDAHDALRRLWNLSHEDGASDEALSKLVRALPRRAAEYLNRRGRMDIDPDQLDALKDWEPEVNPEMLLIKVLSGEGVQIVNGRSRGGGKRSGQRAEPIIMGQARGAGARTHRGGRPESAEEEELVVQSRHFLERADCESLGL